MEGLFFRGGWVSGWLLEMAHDDDDGGDNDNEEEEQKRRVSAGNQGR